MGQWNQGLSSTFNTGFLRGSEAYQEQLKREEERKKLQMILLDKALSEKMIRPNLPGNAKLMQDQNGQWVAQSQPEGPTQTGNPLAPITEPMSFVAPPPTPSQSLYTYNTDTGQFEVAPPGMTNRKNILPFNPPNPARGGERVLDKTFKEAMDSADRQTSQWLQAQSKSPTYIKPPDAETIKTYHDKVYADYIAKKSGGKPAMAEPPTPSNSLLKFASPEEAKQAIRAGKVQKGQHILVDGREAEAH